MSAAALAPADCALGGLRRGAVLVVDDVEANLTAMVALLSELHCEIVLARSGNEALLHLLKRDFAVMLLDVQMPEMDGYEVARYARENPATRDVPIVFSTAGGTAKSGSDLARGKAGISEDGMTGENVLKGYGSGAVDFLFKLVNPSVLRSKVRVFMELDQGRRQLVDARNDLENMNSELRETAESRAALADQFQAANVELGCAYEDLKTAQAGLVHAAKMASRGELVAGIAHEINSPLAFCVSHVETVKRSSSAIEPQPCPTLTEAALEQHWSRAQTRLREMSLGLTRITDLVLKLRTFSRLDEGERQRVDVKECIDAVLGGAGNVYRLVVQDSGSGIDAKLRDRVFEPFFTTKPVGRGTGLGLSIAYSIVQKHGGRLEVEDAPGGGTRMVMQVPLEIERSAAK